MNKSLPPFFYKFLNNLTLYAIVFLYSFSNYLFAQTAKAPISKTILKTVSDINQGKGSVTLEANCPSCIYNNSDGELYYLCKSDLCSDRNNFSQDKIVANAFENPLIGDPEELKKLEIIAKNNWDQKILPKQLKIFDQVKEIFLPPGDSIFDKDNKLPIAQLDSLLQRFVTRNDPSESSSKIQYTLKPILKRLPVKVQNILKNYINHKILFQDKKENGKKDIPNFNCDLDCRNVLRDYSFSLIDNFIKNEITKLEKQHLFRVKSFYYLSKINNDIDVDCSKQLESTVKAIDENFLKKFSSETREKLLAALNDIKISPPLINDNRFEELAKDQSTSAKLLKQYTSDNIESYKMNFEPQLKNKNYELLAASVFDCFFDRTGFCHQYDVEEVSLWAANKPEDAWANPIIDNITVPRWMCLNKISQTLIVHEIGHIISSYFRPPRNKISTHSGSIFDSFANCIEGYKKECRDFDPSQNAKSNNNQSNDIQTTSITETNNLFNKKCRFYEDDFCDTLSFSVLKNSVPQLTRCSDAESEVEYGLDLRYYEKARNVLYETLDWRHSSNFHMLIIEALQKNIPLPQSCNELLNRYKDKFSFHKCELQPQNFKNNSSEK